jgi:hypothetical protein
MIAGDFSLGRSKSFSRWHGARALLIGIAFVITLAIVFAFQLVPESLPLEPGNVSPKTLHATERITYISELQTTQARRKAELEVKEVYDPPNAELAREQVKWASRVLDYVDSVRHDPYAPLDRKIEWVQAIPTVTLPIQVISRTLALDPVSYQRIVSETLYVLDVTMRDTIRPSDISAEYAKIPTRISLALPADHAELVNQWTRQLIVPNSFLNQEKTEAQRSQAGARVAPVYLTYEKGQTIVREGEVFTPQIIEALQAAGFRNRQLEWIDYAGPGLFALLLGVLLAIYLIRLRPALITHARSLLLMAFIILTFTAGARVLGGDRSVLQYLYPISAGVMLLAVLIDATTAFAAALVLALSLGFFANQSLELMLYALAGGLIASVSLGRIERLPAFLWSGTYVALANAAVVAIFRLLAHDTNLANWGQWLAAAIGNGALSGLIALGSLFALGKIFGITTSIELLDLARPTHPLLTKLLVEAPGTYHHSLIVSQLAEQAAQRIGADTLLVRVGAYYHDVGKTREPQSFVENQMDGVNIHDTLEPKHSAGIVIDHVQRGIELAKQYGLPERLREFIPQHHGTTLAAYFHRKAKANGTDINENDYRYPGPKPQSREAAILMLADGVEATTRAERPHSPEQIRAIINRIVNDRLRDGQLDESELTLHDIEQIKEAFLGVLQGLFHPRIKYPEPPPPEKSNDH